MLVLVKGQIGGEKRRSRESRRRNFGQRRSGVRRFNDDDEHHARDDNVNEPGLRYDACSAADHDLEGGEATRADFATGKPWIGGPRSSASPGVAGVLARTTRRDLRRQYAAGGVRIAEGRQSRS